QKSYEALIELAASAPAGSEGLLFLPYLTGERTPHSDPHARGAFFGLTARHTAAHLTRAVLEGVVYSLHDCLEIMTGLGISVAEACSVIRLRPEVAEPEPSRAELYRHYRDAYQELYPATAGVMGRLGELAIDYQGTQREV